jgi:hypothetical protein
MIRVRHLIDGEMADTACFLAQPAQASEKD